MANSIHTEDGQVYGLDVYEVGGLVDTIPRPVEFAVQRKLDYGIPHGYEDDDELMISRRDLNFNDVDWTIYLLLENRNRVYFGSSERDQRYLHDTLESLRVILNATLFDIVVWYAELHTKMTRRCNANLPRVPKVPATQTARFIALGEKEIS